VGIGRVLAIAVFALAAAAAAAAGSGVVVAPHVDPPGTPRFHSHTFAAYRLSIFLEILRARYDPRQGLLSEEPLFDLASSLVLAALAFVWPRLPSPARRAVADMPMPRISSALWRAPSPRGPPRALLIAA
jgi:hypothetical protein